MDKVGYFYKIVPTCCVSYMLLFFTVKNIIFSQQVSLAACVIPLHRTNVDHVRTNHYIDSSLAGLLEKATHNEDKIDMRRHLA